MVALSFEEGFGLRFGGGEDGDRGAALAVEGNIEIADHDVGVLQVRQDVVQGAGLIGFHVHGEDQIHPALVSFFFQCFLCFFRLVHNEADDAEFRTVCSQHGVNINVIFCQNGSHFAERALCIGGENRNLV